MNEVREVVITTITPNESATSPLSSRAYPDLLLGRCPESSLINSMGQMVKNRKPQGLKPLSISAVYGTVEAVP
jgi:hypothetical protein